MFVKVWEVHLKFRLGTKDIDKSHDVFEFRGSVNIVWVGFKRWRNCIFEKDVFRENALSFSGDASLSESKANSTDLKVEDLSSSDLKD